MKGLWEKHYAASTAPAPYGDVTTYHRGALWLSQCQTIEDWGCGLGYFKTICLFPDRVIGVDGSWSRFADKIVDLCDYTSPVEGIFMRHVLEHNLDWEVILENALASFTKRMCLVTFTPFSVAGKTEILGQHDFGAGSIPDLSLPYDDLVDLVGPPYVAIVNEETLKTRTQYGEEHVFYLEKQ